MTSFAYQSQVRKNQNCMIKPYACVVMRVCSLIKGAWDVLQHRYFPITNQQKFQLTPANPARRSASAWAMLNHWHISSTCSKFIGMSRNSLNSQHHLSSQLTSLASNSVMNRLQK